MDKKYPVLSGILSFFVGHLSRAIAGACLLILLITGGVRIHGYWRAFAAVKKGQLVIVSNHPSQLEPLVFFALFWPFNMCIPWMSLWSMPDSKMLPPWAAWLFEPWRCIAFDRSVSYQAGRAMITARVQIKEGDTVVIHPEGGRTHKGTDFVHHGSRHVRRIKTKVPAIIKTTNAAVLPAWVDRGTWPLCRIHFGRVQDGALFSGDDANRKLEEAILTAGQ